MTHFLLVQVALCKQTANFLGHSDSNLPANRLTQLGVRVSCSEDEFIKSLVSQADGVLSKSDVIRLLIQDAMRKGWTPLAHLVDLPIVAPCPAGAGDSEVHVIQRDECVKITQTAVEKTSLPSVGVGVGVGRECEGGLEEGEKSWTPRQYKQHLPSIKRSKVTTDRQIRENLNKHAELINAFWKIKKGSKSDNAWALLQTELTKIQEVFDDDRVEEQLQLAINGLWKGITLRNMQRFEEPSKKATEPEPKHPAYRDFTAERLEREAATNNILKELF